MYVNVLHSHTQRLSTEYDYPHISTVYHCVGHENEQGKNGKCINFTNNTFGKSNLGFNGRIPPAHLKGHPKTQQTAKYNIQQVICYKQ